MSDMEDVMLEPGAVWKATFSSYEHDSRNVDMRDWLRMHYDIVDGDTITIISSETIPKDHFGSKRYRLVFLHCSGATFNAVFSDWTMRTVFALVA